MDFLKLILNKLLYYSPFGTESNGTTLPDKRRYFYFQLITPDDNLEFLKSCRKGIQSMLDDVDLEILSLTNNENKRV